MTSNSGREPSGLRGTQVIREAAGFLQGMEFDKQGGGFARGVHACVMVSPHPQENGEFSLIITCRAFGRRAVDWQTLPVFVARQGGTEIEWLTFPDNQGGAILRGLRPGAYHLLTSPCYSLPQVRQPVTDSVDLLRHTLWDTASSPIQVRSPHSSAGLYDSSNLFDDLRQERDRDVDKPAGPPGSKHTARPRVFASSDGKLTAAGTCPRQARRTHNEVGTARVGFGAA